MCRLPSRLNTSSPVLRIQHSLTPPNRFDKLPGLIDCHQVFIEMHSNEVPLRGCPVLVRAALEEVLELEKKAVA